MNSPAANAVVAELERLGVRLRAEGDSIRFRPKHAVPPDLLGALARVKPEVLALLRTGEAVSPRQPPQTPRDKTDGRACKEASGGSVSTPPTGECASTAPDRPVRWYPCWCCGGIDFWALAEVRHWVCGRCHAPLQNLPGEIIWLRVKPDRFKEARNA